ncbi:MAG TPA: PIN domain-containing protein [Polyangiaceae bacterium]|nr:PIN domain-containing protein [Polyangiaceae bacterium]
MTSGCDKTPRGACAAATPHPRSHGGTVSVQGLSGLANVARRKMLLSWDETNELLATLRRLVAVVPVTVETQERGLPVAERFGLSVHDAMIVAAAAIAGSDILWTEDLQHGAVLEGVRVSNPFLLPQP